MRKVSERQPSAISRRARRVALQTAAFLGAIVAAIVLGRALFLGHATGSGDRPADSVVIQQVTPRPTPKPGSATPRPPIAALTPVPPTPSPVPPGSPGTVRTHSNVTGGWTIDYPAQWWLHFTRNPANNILTSYDAGSAAFQKNWPLETGLGQVPQAEIRVHVEVLDNPQRLTAVEWLKDIEAAPGSPRISSRQDLTLAGQPAVLYGAEEAMRDGHLRKLVAALVPSRTKEQMYWIVAFPVDSQHRADFDRLLSSFRVTR